MSPTLRTMRRSRIHRLFVSCAALIALLACHASAPPPDRLGPEPPGRGIRDPRATDDERRCTSDGECALVSADCCGCEAMGALTGVRTSALAGIKARRVSLCAEVVCAQALSQDPSCAAQRAVCRSNLCIPDITDIPVPTAGDGPADTRAGAQGGVAEPIP